MNLNELHTKHFEYNSDSFLTFEQAWRAKDWMKKHLPHIFNLIKDLKAGYPPTLQEDKNDPKLWKAEHWYWFVDVFIRD